MRDKHPRSILTNSVCVAFLYWKTKQRLKGEVWNLGDLQFRQQKCYRDTLRWRGIFGMSCNWSTPPAVFESPRVLEWWWMGLKQWVVGWKIGSLKLWDTPPEQVVVVVERAVLGWMWRWPLGEAPPQLGWGWVSRWLWGSSFGCCCFHSIRLPSASQWGRDWVGRPPYSSPTLRTFEIDSTDTCFASPSEWGTCNFPDICRLYSRLQYAEKRRHKRGKQEFRSGSWKTADTEPKPLYNEVKNSYPCETWPQMRQDFGSPPEEFEGVGESDGEVDEGAIFNSNIEGMLAIAFFSN